MVRELSGPSPPLAGFGESTSLKKGIKKERFARAALVVVWERVRGQLGG